MEWRIHGVFDRRHGESIEEFECVESSEKAYYAIPVEGFDVSRKIIVESCDVC